MACSTLRGHNFCHSEIHENDVTQSEVRSFTAQGK